MNKIHCMLVVSLTTVSHDVNKHSSHVLFSPSLSELLCPVYCRCFSITSRGGNKRSELCLPFIGACPQVSCL